MTGSNTAFDRIPRLLDRRKQHPLDPQDAASDGFYAATKSVMPHTLYRNRCTDMGMRIISNNLEIIKTILENRVGSALDFQLRQ